MGPHLGVPGAAQGPSGRRRPGAGAGVDRRSWRRWSGTPPSGPRRSTTSAPCAAGSSTTSRRTSWTGRSSAVRAGCATSSSRCSCCSWCTAGSTRRCASPGTLPALRALVAGGYVGRADGEALLRGVPLPAQRRAPAAAAEPAAYAHRARPSRPALRWLAGALGYTADAGPRTPVEAFRADWVAHAARGTPAARQAALPAAAGGGGPGAGRGAAADPGGGPAPAGDPRLRRPGRRAAAPPGAHRRGDPHRGDPADPAAGAAAASSPTRPSRTAACSTTGRSPTSWAARPWYLRLLRDDGPVARRLARVLGLSRYVDRPARPRPGGAAAAGRRRRAGAPRPRTSLRRRLRRGGRPGTPTRSRRSRAVRALRRRELFRVACADLLSRAGALTPRRAGRRCDAGRRHRVGTRWPTSPTPRWPPRCGPPGPASPARPACGSR